MAYAALVSLARIIEQILHLDQDYIYLCGKEHMKSLLEKVIRLQDFLQPISGNIALENRIRDVAYQVEDIVEPIISRSLGGAFQSYDSTQLTPAPTSDAFCSCVNEVDILLEEALKSKKILENKDMLGEVYSRASNSSSTWLPGSMDTKVGLDKDLIQMLDRIIGKGPGLQIVPITGMGGIGKTTLARAVYEDSRMLHRFDVRLWVTVSQEYNLQAILRGLLPKAEQTGPDETLMERVHKRLKRRRFLIVLDDVWDEKAWDGVMNSFPDDNNGSRVILTTRLLKVAKYAGSSSHVHEMQFLNEEKSWDLLREKVYGQEYCPAQFEDIGRAISINCKGLPLSVVVIAGMLKFNKEKDYWEKVAINTIAEAAANYDHLFGILSYSYTNLPPHLKACFLYMGSFKEDYEIPTKELVMLWTGEGFLKPRGFKTMEETAEKCLEELVERSLVLAKKGYNGKIKASRVHDVLREVSLRKALEEKFFYSFTDRNMDEVTSREIIKRQRHVSFSTYDMSCFQPDTYDAPVRSCSFLNNDYLIFDQRLSVVVRFKLLRVLNKVYVDKEVELSLLSRLTNLRYLHFVCDKVGQLIVPESISKLQNLETLIVKRGKYGYELVLPIEIWKMSRLRHLVLMSKTKLPFPMLTEEGYPVLENLQTLSRATNFDFSRDVVEKTPNLKKLKLDYWRMFKGEEREFRLNNLVDLHKLEELAVLCYYPHGYEGPRAMGFSFPRELKKLTLKGSRIPSENMSLVGQLPNLEVLKLKHDSFIGEEWEPVEGEFLRLKYLKEVNTTIGEIETLQKLVLKECFYAKESVRKIREEQQSFANDLLQVIIVYASVNE